MHRIVSYTGCGGMVWKMVCEVMCEDLCQPDDPPVILQEQKGVLVPGLALLSALYSNGHTDISEFQRVHIRVYNDSIQITFHIHCISMNRSCGMCLVQVQQWWQVFFVSCTFIVRPSKS